MVICSTIWINKITIQFSPWAHGGERRVGCVHIMVRFSVVASGTGNILISKCKLQYANDEVIEVIIYIISCCHKINA
jgi:hypothetical protein